MWPLAKRPKLDVSERVRLSSLMARLLGSPPEQVVCQATGRLHSLANVVLDTHKLGPQAGVFTHGCSVPATVPPAVTASVFRRVLAAVAAVQNCLALVVVAPLGAFMPVLVRACHRWYLTVEGNGSVAG